jgi:dihydrofolate reductase
VKASQSQSAKGVSMRKIVAGLFISLDGVAQAPDQWSMEYFNDQLGKEIESLINEQDSVLLGRKSYEDWAAYWPTATQDEDFRDFINNVPKYVFSTTLKKLEWQNSTLLKGDLVEEITKLKQQPGKEIGVHGSISVVDWLMENHLLDELHLWVHPVVAGSGKRLFEDEMDKKPLKLVKHTVTDTGVLLLTYQTEGIA